MSARAWRGRRWQASAHLKRKYARAVERRRKSHTVYGHTYGFPTLIHNGKKP